MLHQRPFLVALLVCLFVGATVPYKLHAQEKLNVILIVVDDMDRAMLNFLGEYKTRNLTPNLDRLAEEGTIFLNQHVASPACTPSRYSVLTGLYASRAKGGFFVDRTRQYGQTHITWNTKILPTDNTLQKVLQAHGYRTGFVGKNHVVRADKIHLIKADADPKDPATVSLLQENKRVFQEAVMQTGFDYAESIFDNNVSHINPSVLAVHNMDWITQGALDFIDQNQERPFFLYVAPTLMHTPIDSEHSWNSDPLATPYGYLPDTLHVQPGRGTIHQRLRENNLPVNDASSNLVWFDDALGALFKKLEETGLDEHSVIFFMNDHGVEEGKSSVYQGGTLAPSIIWRKPGFYKTGPLPTMISNVDIAPTILDLVVPHYDTGSMDGRSFLPVLQGSTEQIHTSLYFELGATRAIRKGNMKYIALRYPKALKLDAHNLPGHVSLEVPGSNLELRVMAQHPYYFDADQLYDLEVDPGEQVNLARDPVYANVLADLQQELIGYLDSLPGAFELRVTRRGEPEVMDDKFTLYQNFPNPFSSFTWIRFQVPVREYLRLSVFDINGREIAVLVDDLMEEGVHTVAWHIIDRQGKRVPSGVYFFRLSAGRNESVGKMVLIR